MRNTVFVHLHNDIANSRLTITGRSKFCKRRTNVNVRTIRLAVSVEEVQMMPGIICPTRQRRRSSAVRVRRKRFTSIASMVVLSQSLNIDLTRRRQVRTAQVHNEHTVHKNPHVIVTSEFENFRSRNLVCSLVLEACITHHGECIVTEMLFTKTTVHRSSVPSSAKATACKNCTRTTLG